jgi:hypothetical protein
MGFDSTGLGAWQAWARLGAASAKMALSASEVFWRRSLMMAQGGMSGPEAARMVMEKPAAFALAAQRAATAAAQGGDMAKVAAAALKPIGARTAANARRLRK